MKTLIIIALSLITLTAFAQKDTVGLKIPYSNGAVVYEKVFEAPGVSKAALLNNGHVWFIQCQKGDDDIQLLDTSLFKIVGKGSEPLSFKGPLNVTYPWLPGQRFRLTVRTINTGAGYIISRSIMLILHQTTSLTPRRRN